MTDKKDTMKILTEDGREVECDILFTFDDVETGKSYIIYTDNSRDEQGNVNVLASVYTPSLEDTRLMPVETEEEWNVIKSILANLQNEIQKKMDDDE